MVKSLKVEKESIEFQTKLYGSKSNKIVNLVLAGLAMRKGGRTLPLVLAATKVTYSTYSNYLTNETNKAIVDEKEHLKKYIDAKNRANFVLEQNPQLERILGFQREDSITINLDEKLTKIYKTNPILRSIFQADQQEFSSEKDLRKDPLFSDAILNPNVFTKLYDMGTGLLNSLNPWGTKVSISSKKEKIDSKKTASSVLSTKKTALAEPIVTIEQEDLGSLIPANLLKDIRDNVILRNLKSRSESPTTVTVSFSPTGSPKYR